MKKGMPWASPSLDAWVFLNIAGMTHGGIPKFRLFTLLDHIISSFSLAPWKLPSHQTQDSFIRGLVQNQKLLYSVMIQSIPKLLDISYSHQCFVEQRNPHKHSKRANAKQKAESVKKQNSLEWRIFSRHLIFSDGSGPK